MLSKIKTLLDIAAKLLMSGEKYAQHKGVKLGSHCRILTSNFGSEPFLITIGDHCTITSGVRILTHDGATWLLRDEKGRRFSFAPVNIGDHVFVGVNSIIMPGVNIGSRVIVAAGSVVTKSVPSGKIVGGNPARIIGEYDDYERKGINTFFSKQDWDESLAYEQNVRKLISNSQKPELR